MNLIDRIKNVFRREPPQAPGGLRNKPGGYAWINSRAGRVPGAEILVGRAVKTVSMTPASLWRIEPPQQFVVQRPTKISNGRVVPAGTSVVVIGIADETLDPWKEDGVTDGEVAELYAPNAKEGERV